MSKQVDEVIDVCRDLKETILKDIDSGTERNLDDIDSLTTGSFKKVAERRGIRESTVRKHCTTLMDMNSKEFYDAIKDQISGKKGRIPLKGRILSGLKSDDNEWEVEKKLDEIFGKD